MTQRLEQVQARLTSVRQLDGIVTAMRNMASTRARQARLALPGVRGYAANVGQAIGSALAFDRALPARDAYQAGGTKGRGHVGDTVVFAFGSEQGFVGALNENLLAKARSLGGALVVSGRRLHETALEHQIALAAHFPMPTQPNAAPVLAMAIADWLYNQVLQGGAGNVRFVFPVKGATGSALAEIRQVMPFDFTRFQRSDRASAGNQPLTNIAPEHLLAKLADEYVFASLCEAIVQTMLAENEVRVAAMTAARDNIEETQAELERLWHAMQQEIITSEVIELSAGVTASRQTQERNNKSL